MAKLNKKDYEPVKTMKSHILSLSLSLLPFISVATEFQFEVKIVITNRMCYEFVQFSLTFKLKRPSNNDCSLTRESERRSKVRIFFYSRVSNKPPHHTKVEIRLFGDNLICLKMCIFLELF